MKETRNSAVLTGSVLLAAVWIARQGAIAGFGQDQFASRALWFAGSVALVYLLAQFEHLVARHDTFRQVHQGASLEVPVADDSLPAGALGVSPARPQQACSMELAEALSRIQEEALKKTQPGKRLDFRVLREGAPRLVDSVVWDEVYRIGHEALFNAFRHARARHIAVEVKYSAGSLHLVVRDDGCGFGSHVFACNGSYSGLYAMQDRAERIGAHLRLRSAPRRGTELELSVPAFVAFPTAC
jgi:glucose-6-phosphate-specific signal transduction histidine kinase